MRNINAAILMDGWKRTHSTGDDMAEKESARLRNFKSKMKGLWDHQLYREIFDNSNRLLRLSSIGTIEKAWGLYYRALGRFHLDDSERQNIKLNRCLNDINEAIELKNMEPDFYALRAKIHKSRGNIDEANSDITQAIDIINDRGTDQSKVTPEKMLEYHTTRAEIYIILERPHDAVNELTGIVGSYFKEHNSDIKNNFLKDSVETLKEALNAIHKNELNTKLEAKNTKIIELEAALEAAKIIDNPEQINEDFADRISTSATRLAALRKITERNSKCLTFRVSFVIILSLIIQLGASLLYLCLPELLNFCLLGRDEPSPYFYITVTTGTILIVSSIFYQLRQANHNERVELHLHEDLQRKKTLMLYATSITTDDRVAAQKQIIDHFDYRGTPEQLADLYHKGKGQPKAEDQLEKIAQAIKDISKNQ